MSAEIMQNAVGGLIATEAHVLIAFVLSRINREIKLAWGFKNELVELQGQLTRLSWPLEGASVQPNTNPLMVNWLNKIRDAANDADDLLDEWSYEVLKRRVQNRKRDKLKHGVSYPILCVKMAHKVRDLRKLIGSIYIEANDLGIKTIKVAAGYVYNGHISILEIQDRRLLDQRYRVDQECFYGRGEATTLLVKSLCEASSRDADLTVIGVVGMAGLGKTTLCKRVYMEKEVIQKFDCQVIWLVVSHSYKLSDILNRMVEILFEIASSMIDNQAIVQKLQKKLKGKKYLLILDDVWNTLDWEPLKATLLEIGGSKGTSLLVTSRDKNVVTKMETYSCDCDGKKTTKMPIIHPLQGLSKDDSWSLFMVRMCVDDLASRKKELMARRMIERCGGVPLAIRALGDLLRDKSIGMWKEIEESEIWMKEDEYGILPSLKLSFYYLPNMALKKCFSYCAIFEEDEVIEKDRLIYMWMAQGFLLPYDDITDMELVGEEYCKILLNCSFLQDARKDKWGNVIEFQMRDLVRSLACVVSREDSAICTKFNPICCEKLQTFFPNWSKANLDIVKNCRRLRVLRIDNGKLLKLGALDSLLKHLRYLHVSIEKFEMISAEICELYHLQTLHITLLSSEEDKSLKLVLPQNIGHLANLRHITYTSTVPFGIPEGLRHLTSLRTLPAIDLKYDWGGKLSELAPLVNLQGTLEIQHLNCITDGEEARSLILGNKSNIHELVLLWSYSGYNVVKSINEILEALQPHATLAMLRVKNYNGTRFPRWLIEKDSPLINLVSLTLQLCMYAEGILHLENFKSLRFLDIWRCPQLTISFPIEGFQCCRLLEEIKVYSCGKVEISPDSSLINLVSLTLEDCAEGILYLENFKSLRYLDVRKCPRLTISFPVDGLNCCKLLEEMTVYRCCKVYNFLDLSSLSKLRILKICGNDFKNTSELAGLASLPHLCELRNDEFRLPADLGKYSPICKSLEIIDISPTFGEREFLPVQLQHLVALQQLHVHSFAHLEILPDWLGNLTSLRLLTLKSMPKLKCLPYQDAIQRLSNLQYLFINKCPLLNEDIKNQTGEWLKIAHISIIQNDLNCGSLEG